MTTPPVIESGDPPNALDRLLVSALIDALTASATAVDVDSSAILNTLTPPGQYRVLHVADQNADPVTWPGQLPRPSRVVSAVVATLLDDLGSHLTERGRSVGPIADDQRTKVLNTEVVPNFGDRLSALLAERDDSELLRHLIRANEALLREGRVEQKTFPSRVACFGRQSDIVERFSNNMTESANAAVSSRFLIDYVSGNPAVGALAVTAESYDMMLALASEVTNNGFLSDAIHAEISTATVSILPSGRLGIARDDDRWVTRPAQLPPVSRVNGSRRNSAYSTGGAILNSSRRTKCSTSRHMTRSPLSNSVSATRISVTSSANSSTYRVPRDSTMSESSPSRWFAITSSPSSNGRARKSIEFSTRCLWRLKKTFGSSGRMCIPGDTTAIVPTSAGR